MKNLGAFAAEYHRQLEKAITEHPTEYVYGLDMVPTVVDRMIIAFERGSYNKDGRAIKATCKVLGVKYTYTGINEFLRGI